MMGRSATAVGRMTADKTVPFTPNSKDASQNVSGYIFEGPILAQIEMHLLPDKAKINIDNIIASAVAHELGHNLGLGPAYTPFDIMYVYASDSRTGEPNSQQKQWMILAEQNKLRFKPHEFQKIRLVLDKK